MPDILALGELLIDFTPAGVLDTGMALFSRNPGGAPANVAVQAARLGVSSGFIGKVGNDAFGKFLKKTLEENAVDTHNLILDAHAATTLAFVELSETGDRSFSFYRNPGADTCLLEQEVDVHALEDCKLLHFGSLLFTDEPSRGTSLRLLAYARQAGKILSYDPNWRPMLWRSQEDGVREMKNGLAFCDILKVSDEELSLVTGCTQMDEAIHILLERGIAVVVVTLGAQGCRIGCHAGMCSLSTYDVRVRDTTGSGDSFFGAFLYCVVSGGKTPGALTLEELKEYADFANAAGALCASAVGAIPAMPGKAEIEYCRETVQKMA